MGFFKKKPDPVNERAKALDQQIAALQAEIAKLSEEASTPSTGHEGAKPGQSPGSRGPAGGSPTSPPPPAAASSQGSSAIPRFSKGGASPRLRSTTLPQRASADAASAHEPIFEEVNQPQIKADTELPPAPEDLGMRKSDLGALWQRVLRHFRGPVTSNPKLVNYLAAGSIQGLQPLRYEKRVARNRFIVFVVLLALVLWGLSVMLFGRR